MDTYKVQRGTRGLLIIEAPGEDVVTQDWETRKDFEYERQHVLVDPALFKNHNGVYPEKSLAARLAKQDYMVFANTDSGRGKYSLAIQMNDVVVS